MIQDDYILGKVDRDRANSSEFVQINDEMEEDRKLLVTQFKGMLLESKPITIE